MTYRTAQDEIAAEFYDFRGGLPYAVPEREDIIFMLTCSRKKLRDYRLLRLLYAAGLRRQEVARLQVSDLFWDSRTLFIRASKGNKDRYVLVDRVTMAELRSQVGQASPQDLVFGMGADNVSRIFRSYANKSGLYAKYHNLGRSLCPHSFRHAFATHSYENGLDFLIINRLMGHTFYETTAIYTRTASRQIDAAYDRSQPFAPDTVSKGGLPASLTDDAQGDPGPSDPKWPEEQEFADEFATQFGGGNLGRFLPVSPDLPEMRQMLEGTGQRGEDYALLRLLYATGLRPQERAQLQPHDFNREHRRIQLGPRWLRVDQETLDILAQTGLEDVTEEQIRGRIQGYAEQTGVVQRFQSMGRTFTAEALRYAFAIHSCERGIDRMTLMHQLGHAYLSTTAVYFNAAVARWLPEFDRHQELSHGHWESLAFLGEEGF